VTNSKKLKIAVIGAGAAGIMAVIKLREIGQTDVRVFEAAADIGGTWRDNRYPGIACDVPSHLYRYSFAPNADWSRVCASGSEILDYIRRVYNDFDIQRHVTFNAEVKTATYGKGTWTLETTAGTHGPFDVVITAMGILRQPALPDIEGLDSFEGVKFHTLHWRDDVPLEGRRVGIIGTGSTATQIITAIVARTGKLSVFQRTAQWIMPLPNTPIPEEDKERFRQDPVLMQKRYDDLADDFNNKWAAAIVGQAPRVYAHIERACLDNLEQSVKDPVLREKLRPNYKVGCKRLVMSDGFYDAIRTGDRQHRAHRAQGRAHRRRPPARAGRADPGHRLQRARHLRSDEDRRPRRTDDRGGLEERRRSLSGGDHSRLPQLLHDRRAQQPDRQLLVPDDGGAAMRLRDPHDPAHGRQRRQGRGAEAGGDARVQRGDPQADGLDHLEHRLP
jgi:cation diffusion facilitator CzcD-associated flavoprotein CzcO